MTGTKKGVIMFVVGCMVIIGCIWLEKHQYLSARIYLYIPAILCVTWILLKVFDQRSNW